MWYQKLLTKKKAIFLVGIALVLLSLISHLMAIGYWSELDWQVTGYHPLIPAFVIAMALLTMATLFLKKVHSFALWGIAVIALIYGCIMAWMLWL